MDWMEKIETYLVHEVEGRVLASLEDVYDDKGIDYDFRRLTEDSVVIAKEIIKDKVVMDKVVTKMLQTVIESGRFQDTFNEIIENSGYVEKATNNQDY